jgi:hypothetical protein
MKNYFDILVPLWRVIDATTQLLGCLLVATNRPSWPAIPRHLKQMFEIKPLTNSNVSILCFYLWIVRFQHFLEEAANVKIGKIKRK